MVKKYLIKMRYAFVISMLLSLQFNCKKNSSSQPVGPVAKPLIVKSILLAGNSFDDIVYGTGRQPVISVKFSEPVMQNTIATTVKITDAAGTGVSVTASLRNNDSVLIIQPSASLTYLSKYFFKITTFLKSASGGNLTATVDKTFITQIDSTRKFPIISDDALLDLIQRQTFKYFWDYGHPVSGLARERSNSTPETVTSGGSGFGIMAIPVGINRNFITRAQGLTRMQTIVSFFKNTAQKFHGAFPHWLNGTTGVVIPFSPKDNGADLVETSYLMAGLLAVRQYFNGADAVETTLRNDITALYNNVEWDWFRNGSQNVLYWHWSPNFNWEMNFPLRGWNECLITYVLAASSPTHGIPLSVYTNGWAGNGSNGFKNGSTYYTYQLPLGPSLGGPLFFSHYSFLGINPNGLSDVYANYQTQTKNHTLINYEYCKANPKSYFGYSDSCWGLTASDIKNDYTASSPTNDVSFIAPTAALSSFPYTPAESMKALKFFYYVLGDKIFKDYGFVDAFSLKELWYANSFLAIDQGPIIVMIENYRSQLIWNLFTSCPEVKNGMKNVLGFTAPYL
jgi:hypothetical protein